jgi:osmotically-inducible protein OsmY
MAKHIRKSEFRGIRAADVADAVADADRMADTVVPSLSDSVHIALGRHQVEQAVQRELLSHPQLHFTTLVVRRTQNGVCLEGYLEAGDNCPDVGGIARTIAGVDEVINHLMVKRPEAAKN